MSVFVTGATGLIVSFSVCELFTAGHEVVGLAPSDQAAASLKAAGPKSHSGALDDLDSLRADYRGASSTAKNDHGRS